MSQLSEPEVINPAFNNSFGGKRAGRSATLASDHFPASSAAPASGELLVLDYPTELGRQAVSVSDRRGAGGGGTDLQRENVISWLVGSCNR